MENKVTKDTTKEEHYIKIVAGFKIIYNQNQYLAYTEVPKKKRDFPLEIYVGRLSMVREQFLLFKCETASEKEQVFGLFKQVFSKTSGNDIELVDFSNIERISIVSSNEFDEKMDQYPNFFTLPEKEEEDVVNITLPKFLMKKSASKQPKNEIAEMPEIIDVNSSNTVAPDINLEENVVPIAPKITNQNEITQQPINSKEVPISMPNMAPQNTDITMNNEINQSVPVQNQAEQVLPENDLPINPVMPTINTLETNTNPILQTQSVEETQITPASTEEAILPPTKQKKPKNKKGNNGLIIIIVVLLLAVIGVGVYLVITTQKENGPIKEQPNEKPNVPTTQNLVCTMSTEDADLKISEDYKVTIEYNIENKKVLNEEIAQTTYLEDTASYSESKDLIQGLEATLPNTDGLKKTYTFDDAKQGYSLLEKRDYEKATEEEKDTTWNENYDDIYEYYLDLGYTCNGVTRTKANITSRNGREEISYNKWNVKFKSATIADNKRTMTVKLEVTNEDTETRKLNGKFKLYDENKENLRNAILDDEIKAGEMKIITVNVLNTNTSADTELGSLDTIDLTELVYYLIELYL